MGSSERSAEIDTATGGTVPQVVAPLHRAETDTDADAERGRPIGRYVVVERIGSGGMGIVYKALDPELGRMVAIKVVKRARSEHGRERLLREAQALARLSHPHVIAVHDVGTVDDEVFIAMELVEGPSLKEWLTAAPRTRAQILAVYTAAGEGIAAAHAVGLVHRDVKPANIMIGADGRVRVLDFGVARATGADGDGAISGLVSGTETGRTPRFDDPLTQAGALVGTPRYMAPEQYLRKEVDARTDQFAFAVALWEALAGEHPFGPREGRRQRVLVGELAPARGLVTRRLRRLLARATATSPAERWASMSALIAALRRDPARELRRAGAGVAVVGVLGIALASRSADEPPCQGAPARVATIWGAPQRTALTLAFERTGVPFAGDASHQVSLGLDRWTDRWAAMHLDACQATMVRGEQSEALLDLRMACLERRRERAGAAIALLTSADPEVVAHAGDVVDDLPTLAECADVEALRRAAPPPATPSLRAQLAQAQAALARAQALDTAGKYAAASEAASQAIAAGRAAGDSPTVAEALIVFARAKGATGGEVEVAPALREAMRTAALGRADAIEARAWTTFVHQVGDLQSHYDQVEPWLPQVAALVERTGDPALTAELDFDLAAMAWRRGRYDEALDHARRSMASYEALYGRDDRRAMRPLWVIGNVTDERGDHAAAVPIYQRILDVDRAVLGDRHPIVARDYINVGTALGGTNDDAAALYHYQRGLAILEVAAPDSAELYSAVINIGTVQARQGLLALAASSYARALAIIERTLGPEHPDVAHALMNAAETMRAQGALDESERALARTLAIWTKSYGPDHPYLAYAELAMATTLGAAHRPKESLASARRGLAIATAQLGAEHEIVADLRATIGAAEVALGHAPVGIADERAAVALAEKVNGSHAAHTGAMLVTLGRDLARTGDRPGAAVVLERAREIGDATHTPPLAAEARIALAETIADPARALVLATEARAALGVPGAGPSALLAETEAWLAAHGGR
ncbi:MAG: serine/threonine-protein kinase [Deltaproteobacteria bacterium]|nr:serine/threonine-protein kinase [Deltaproteobacteria bacterium]